MKQIKQLVFLSIMLQSRNKVAMKTNERTKEATVRNKHLSERKERRHG